MLTKAMEECIDICEGTAKMCRKTARHCWMMGGKHAEESHLNLLKDCAEICMLHAELMERESKYHKEFGKLCAKVCEDCAKMCATLDPKDEKMQECAQICQSCAESCKEMSK